jgi:hypothetical protein
LRGELKFYAFVFYCTRVVPNAAVVAPLKP